VNCLHRPEVLGVLGGSPRVRGFHVRRHRRKLRSFAQ
jgi:hypothetical protein